VLANLNFPISRLAMTPWTLITASKGFGNEGVEGDR
jgi:hypothetical protein